MKRAAACVLLLLCLSACAPAAPVEGGEESYYTFVDSVGREVSLPAPPERVAVLFSSYAQIWTLAGGSVAVTVGESVERGLVPEGTALVDAGAGKSIDRELLLAARPDLIIASADIEAQAETCRAMEQAGIPSALFRVDTFEDYLAMLRICTDITGCESAYLRSGEEVAGEVSAVLERAESALERRGEARRILFIRAAGHAGATKAKRAPENFVCVMLDQLGAENIADSAPLLLDGLSLEEILLCDPDYIFLTAMGSEDAARAYIADLFAQEGWRELQAVKTGSYTFLDKELFHYKPNARWGEAYALLAQLLYPEES